MATIRLLQRAGYHLIPDPGGTVNDTPRPALAGSRCTTCGTVGFPASERCSRCATATAVPHELSTSGRVWSYTVQRFAPKSPPYVPPAGGFEPFAMGYVELPDGLRVTAVLDAEGFGDRGFDNLMGARAELTSSDPVPRFTVYPDTAEGTIT